MPEERFELMGTTFIKRYRMEIDLGRKALPELTLPSGYVLLHWLPELLEPHIDVKYRSFRDEIDSRVFACFTARDGCRRVMEQIVHRDGFLPETTWLAACVDSDEGFGPETADLKAADLVAAAAQAEQLQSDVLGEPEGAAHKRVLEYCGTIQGRRRAPGLGTIQNIGVVPEHRRRGLAKSLIIRSLEGFYSLGYGKVQLDVTAENDIAIRLYMELGFRIIRTLYKESIS